MAVTYGGLNANAPFGFRNLVYGFPNKHLLNPIQGTYPNFEQYLQGTATPFTPMYTDSNGQVQYTSLMWNTDGLASTGLLGRYFLLFICNGVPTSPIQQQVRSRISTIVFSKAPLSSVKISSSTEYDLAFHVRVTDSSGKGVKGKYIYESNPTVASPHQASDLGLTMRNDIEEFSISDQNGFMSIPFKVSMVKASSLSATFTLKVDDATLITSAITISGNLQAVPNYCAFMITQTDIPETTTNGNPFTPVFKAVKQDGSPWVGGQATLGVTFTPEYPYKIKHSVINNVNTTAATVTSDSQGVLTFTNFKFLQQPAGTAFLEVIGKNSGVTNCKSDLLFTTVQDTIGDLTLLSPTNAQLGNFDKTIPFDTDQATTIRIVNSNSQPLAGRTVTVALQIAHMPVNLYSEYYQNQNSSDFFTMSSSTITSDSNGDVKFNWKLGKGRAGQWAIVFLIDGKYTFPFSFNTTWDASATVTILRQPVVASGNQPVGEYLDSNGGAAILVKDSSNNPMENFMVSTYLIPVDGSGNKDTSSNRKQGMLDIYTYSLFDLDTYIQAGNLDLIGTSFITHTGEKNGKTNSSGIVVLNKLTIIDVLGNAAGCFKFYFFIGTHERGQLIKSVLSDSVCFINQMDIAISNSPSTKISPNHVFVTPPTLRVTKQTASDSDKTGLIILVAVASSINQAAVANKFFGLQSYFEKNVCIFYNKANIAGGCSAINVINDGTNGSYLAETTFSGLKFIDVANIDLVARFSTPFQFSTQFMDSSTINVSIQPNNIELIDQPPSSVKTNELFQVKVKATLSNGTPLSFVQVFANITASSTVSSFTNSIFSYAANLQTTINNLNQLSATNNIRLNNAGATALTNTAGIATLTLQIIGGVSGSYTVVASSGQGVQSPPSNAITFQNEISTVSLISNLEQSHDVHKQTISNKDVYQLRLSPQPVVTVTKADGTKITTAASGFSVLVIQQTDVLSAYNKLGLAREAHNPGISAILQNIQQPQTGADSALSTIFNAWTILTKGASNIGAVNKRALSAGATFSAPTLNSDNNYVFTDLTVRVITPAKYQLIFMVDGVQSDLSQNVEVNDKAVTTTDRVVSILIIVAIVLMMAFLLYSALASNAYTYSRCMNGAYIIVSIVFAVILFTTTILNQYPLTLKIFMSITIVLIMCSLVYAMIQLFSPKCRKYIFYVEWEKSARQYTYQKLFRRPSNKWMAKRGKPGAFKEQTELKQMKSRNANKSYQQESHDQISPNFGQQKKQSEFGEFQFFKKKMGKRFLDLLVPFQVSGNRLNVGDCFFYPQRFFIGFIIAFFAFIFIAVNLFLMIERLRNSINSLQRNVFESIYGFIRIGVKNIYSWVKIDVANGSLSPFIATSHTIEDFLKQLSLAFYIGSIIGAVVATLIMVCSILTLFYDYKKRVLQARVGYWPYPIKRFSLINSTSYVGSLISTFLLGYAVIAFLLTLIFVPLSHPVTYKILWAFRIQILIILLPTIINSVLKIIAKKVCVAKTHVRYRRCFAILDLLLLYLAIPAGIVTGLVRFIIMLVVGILTLSKIDTPIAPMWIMNRLMWVDFPNGAYNGLILEHHTHRNPILTTAIYAFLSCLQHSGEEVKHRSLKENRDDLSKNARRVTYRFQLALLLAQNPSLIKYRKHNLPPKKSKAKPKSKNMIDRGEEDYSKSPFENSKQVNLVLRQRQQSERGNK